MITRLHCSFRRNSHTPCLHPVIHLELPLTSLDCFPNSGFSTQKSYWLPQFAFSTPSGHKDYLKILPCVLSKDCIAILDHWTRLWDPFFTDFFPLTFHLTLFLYLAQPKKLFSVRLPLKHKKTHLSSSSNFVHLDLSFWRQSKQCF